MRTKLFVKIYATVVIVFASTLAILGITVPRSDLSIIITITNLFDIMIPVLAVGAYILLIIFLVRKW